MTLADLQSHVWQSLGVRKHLAGRATVNELVEATVAEWQGKFLSAAASDAETAVVCEGMAVAVKRSHQMMSGIEPKAYGFLWSLVLGSIVSAVISTVLRWWLERRTHRVMMAVWKHELTGGAAT